MKKTKIILIILAAALLSALTAFAVSSANDVMMTFDKGTEDTVTNMPQDEALTLEYVVPENVPEREGYEFLYWTLDRCVVKANYTVYYLEEGTDCYLADPKYVDGGVSAFDVVTEIAIPIDKYELVSSEEQSIVLSVDSSKNVIKFYYKKLIIQTSYTVVCCDELGNDITPALLNVPVEGLVGESVTITAPGSGYEGLEYYELSAGSPYSYTRELSENENENVFVFTYSPKTLTYYVRYVLYGTDDDIAEPVTCFAFYNTTQTERAREIEGYNIKGSTRKRVTISEDGIVIIFYYAMLE